MYRSLSFAVIAPCYNEEKKIGTVVSRLRAIAEVDEIIVVDDGSTDRSARVASEAGATVLSLETSRGVGAALKAGFEYAKHKYAVIVVIGGNNKDEPREISRLLEPIAEGKADFVQGSRFLSGGNYGGDMPFYRKIATRIHPLLFTFATGRKVTDSTNGFRAFRTSLLDHPDIQWQQAWLDHYELEPYFFYKVVQCGIPFCEVPVTKIYPQGRWVTQRCVPSLIGGVSFGPCSC